MLHACHHPPAIMTQGCTDARPTESQQIIPLSETRVAAVQASIVHALQLSHCNQAVVAEHD